MSPDTRIPCPECATPMAVVPHDSVQVDVCRCGGMWFDAGELTAWRRTHTAEPIASQRQGTTATPCPRCPEQRLLAHTIATIPVRACQGCHGVFVPATSVVRLDPRVRDASGPGFGGIAGDLVQLLGNALFFL